MKRKLAVLLAGVITIASMPMNVFVAEPFVTGTPAVTRLSRSVMLAPSRTAFLEAGASDGAMSGEVANSDQIQHWVEGGNFNIIFQEDHPTDRPVQFTLDLDNAEWFFRNAGSADTGNLGRATFNTANGTWDETTRVYTRTGTTSPELAYTLQVSAGNPSRATVTITEAARSAVNNRDVVQASAYVAADTKTPKDKEKPESKLASPTTKPEVEIKEDKTKEKKEKLEIKTAPNAKPEVEIKEDKTKEKPAKTAAVEVANIQVDAMSPYEDAYDHLRTALSEAENAENYIGTARGLAVGTSTIAQVETPTTNARDAVVLAQASLYGETAVGTVNTELQDAFDELEVALSALVDMEVTDNTDPFLTTGYEHTEFMEALGLAETSLGEAVVSLNSVIPVPVPPAPPAPGPTLNGGVRDGEIVSIPLVVRTIGENVDASIRVSQSNPVSIQTDRRVFSQATQVGLTTTSISSPRSGRDRVEIPSIGISENRIGAFPTSGSFELVAPSGYHFANIANGNGLTLEGGVNPGIAWDSTMELRNDATVLRVTYENLVRSTTMTGTLALTNLTLVASNADSIRSGDIYLNIRNVGSPAVVTPQRFLAGTVADWGLNMVAIGTAPELINGRLRGIERTDVADQYHRAATVRVEERVENAWWAQRSTTFTLPEQVRVRKVEFNNVRNISNYEELQGSFYNDRNRAASANVRVNDNIVTLTGLQTSNTSRASFEMDLWLNIESGFEGDINLEIGGSALTDDNLTQSVKIATAINPVQVNAEVTNVRVGYQFVPVGDFSIVEKVEGALLANEQIFISVTDNMFSDMHIAPGFDWEVTQGDIRVRNMRTGTNLWLNNNNNNNVNLSFEVERQSTEPSEISFSNVQVRLVGNVPASSQGIGHDLVVWGPAIAANFEGIRDEDADINRNDFFREAGIRTSFVNVEEANVNANANSALTNIVKVTANSPVIRVNDTEMVMDTAPFVSTLSDSMMVPVRFVSMGLGIEAHRVLWSPDTSTVTVDAGERIIQFQTNSSIMRINGIEVPMLNANGQPVYSEVRDERAFIPFRALADALNIFIDWDAATATATFDPTRPATRAQGNNINLEGRTIAYYGNYNQNQNGNQNGNQNQNVANGYMYSQNVTPIQNRSIMNGITQRSNIAPSNTMQEQNRGIINRTGGIQTRTPSYVLNRTYTHAAR